MPLPTEHPEAIARRVALEYAALPGVEAVAMAGSRASERADRCSDVDLYVYADTLPPPQMRAEIARGTPREMGNQFFEPGDEWIDEASGAHLDVMFRRLAFIEDELDRLLVRHEARVGYSTALWHAVRASVPLFDRNGWYARLLERAQSPYPEPLVRAVVEKNQPLLRRNLSSFLHQVEKAVARHDRISVNHRVAAFLASAFDLLFALNRLPHPGEKRLLEIALASCPHRPPDLSSLVDGILEAERSPDPDLVRRMDQLGEQIDALLREGGLLR
ncbi:MAG TPA: hypothetical protein VFG59_04225 [Anaeromyxobacter sp.]|nr:hypothetical protein [Anaeromyxobacter sp.]